MAVAALVAERIRREKGRLLLPSLFLNGFQTPNEYLQVGAQGFGGNGNLNQWSARDDFSPQMLWQFEALGMGNLALVFLPLAAMPLAIYGSRHCGWSGILLRR